jgi:hypothetical protein
MTQRKINSHLIQKTHKKSASARLAAYGLEHFD